MASVGTEMFGIQVIGNDESKRPVYGTESRRGDVTKPTWLVILPALV